MSVQRLQQVAKTPAWIVGAFVGLAALAGYTAYNNNELNKSIEAAADKSHAQMKLLETQLDQTNARMSDLNGDLTLYSQKLGLMESGLARTQSMSARARKDQRSAAANLSAQIGQVRQDSDTKIGQVASDLNGAKSDIDGTKKDLDATKTRLDGALGDINTHGGLIARNRDELEELKRRGERNIFEFDLRSSKRPTHIGPVQLTLNRVDTRKYRYTMTVLANDRSVQKRDKTVDEPVMFYIKGNRVPYEIVVFEVSKNHAVGYLSTPKAGSV